MAKHIVFNELLRGKTIARALQNRSLAELFKGLAGSVLDLGGGHGSYYRFIPTGMNVVRTNVQGSDIDAVIDFNAPLPFAAGEFQNALLLNALYIAEDPLSTLREVRRVLSPGGTLILATPYLMPEMREPHDYARFTSEMLETLLHDAGFIEIHMEGIGERGTAAAHLLDGGGTRMGRILSYMLGSAIDRMIPARITHAHPAPISYLTRATT